MASPTVPCVEQLGQRLRSKQQRSTKNSQQNSEVGPTR